MHLQGAALQSSDRGAVRIQYSRNPFGKKRDFNHYSGDGGGGGGSGAGRAAIIPQAAAPQQAAENALPGVASEHTAAATAQFETVAQAQQQQQQQGEVQAGAPNTQQVRSGVPSDRAESSALYASLSRSEWQIIRVSWTP